MTKIHGKPVFFQSPRDWERMTTEQQAAYLDDQADEMGFPKMEDSAENRAFLQKERERRAKSSN